MAPITLVTRVLPRQEPSVPPPTDANPNPLPIVLGIILGVMAIGAFAMWWDLQKKARLTPQVERPNLHKVPSNSSSRQSSRDCVTKNDATTRHDELDRQIRTQNKRIKLTKSQPPRSLPVAAAAAAAAGGRHSTRPAAGSDGGEQTTNRTGRSLSTTTTTTPIPTSALPAAHGTGGEAAAYYRGDVSPATAQTNAHADSSTTQGGGGSSAHDLPADSAAALAYFQFSETGEQQKQQPVVRHTEPPLRGVSEDMRRSQEHRAQRREENEEEKDENDTRGNVQSVVSYTSATSGITASDTPSGESGILDYLKL